MKITFKDYKCGVCDNIQKVDTNHYGEIYSHCKNCGHSVLECIESEATTEKQKRNITKATVYTYRLDISKDNDLQEYKKIQEINKNKKLFDFIGGTFKEWDLLIKGFNNKDVNLYDIDTFETQYIGDGARWHDWSERIVPNASIKCGYYLVFPN